MRYQIEDITAFDQEDSSGIIAKVSFLYDDHNQATIVHVRLPLDKEASLAVIEERIFEEAKFQIKSLVSEF